QGRVGRAARQPARPGRSHGQDLEIRTRLACNWSRRSNVRGVARTESLHPARRSPAPNVLPRSLRSVSMKNRPRVRKVLTLSAVAAALLLTVGPPAFSDDPANGREGPHRSPIALALSTDGTRLLTANQTAGSVSLVDTASGRVLAEVATGDRPAGVALS